MCVRERERAIEMGRKRTAVARMWHIQDSHGQLLALAFG